MKRAAIVGQLSPVAEIPRAVLSIVWAVVGVNYALNNRYAYVFPTIDGVCQLLGVRNRENTYQQVSRGVKEGWLLRDGNRVGITKKTTGLIAAALSQCCVIEIAKQTRNYDRRIDD